MSRAQAKRQPKAVVPGLPDALPIYVDANQGAVDLVRDLARAGLALVDRDGHAWLVRLEAQDAPKAAMSEPRRLLFGALAIVTCCRHALDSQIVGLDKQSVIDALQVAGSMLDDIAATMEVQS